MEMTRNCTKHMRICRIGPFRYWGAFFYKNTAGCTARANDTPRLWVYELYKLLAAKPF